MPPSPPGPYPMPVGAGMPMMQPAGAMPLGAAGGASTVMVPVAYPGGGYVMTPMLMQGGA